MVLFSFNLAIGIELFPLSYDEGSGAYCDNASGAASTTGHGESIVKVTLAREVVYNMKNGTLPWQFYLYIYIYTPQKKLRVKGNFFIIFVICLHLCEHHFGGYMTFFHQGNKLVSNQKCFFLCFLFVSHQIIILSLVVTILAR